MFTTAPSSTTLRTCVFLPAQRRKRGEDVRTYVYVYCLCAGRRPGGPAREPARGPVRGPAGRPCKAGEGGGRVGVPREGRAAGRAAGGHGSRREAGLKARPGDALRCGPGTGPCALRCASPTTAPNTVPRPTPRTGPYHTLFPFGPNRKGILTTKADEPPVLPRRWPENRPFSDVGGRQTARASVGGTDVGGCRSRHSSKMRKASTVTYTVR